MLRSLHRNVSTLSVMQNFSHCEAKLVKNLETYPKEATKNCEKPKSSEVLTHCLLQTKANWTSYFVRYNDIEDDQWGMSHFNWKVDERNFHVLRTGCYPFIKYHCTERPHADLRMEDAFFRAIKVMNFGIPCLGYGIAAIFLISHQELVKTPKGDVVIHYLYKESGSQY